MSDRNSTEVFPEKIEAILLAGGSIKGLSEQEPKLSGKGHYQIGGLPMAARTLRALVEAKRISDITLVTPVSAAELGLEWSGVSHVAPAGEKLLDSAISGFSCINHPTNPVLLVAGDLPFLTAQSVDDFVERCQATPPASLWYGFLRKENSEKKFPGIHHTWVRLKEGVFCGSGLSCMRPNAVGLMKDALALVTRGRKNPFIIAKVLGFKTLLYLALHKLTVPMTEEAGARLLKTTCFGIESPFAEVAYNVDDAESLAQAREMAKS